MNDIVQMNTSDEDSEDIDDIDLITALINEHPELFIDVKEKKKRHRREKIPFSETPWGRLLASPGIENPISYHARLFRITRFRVPYLLFRDWLVPVCKVHNIFNLKIQSRVPIEYKILVALRILGRDCDADTASEWVMFNNIIFCSVYVVL